MRALVRGLLGGIGLGAAGAVYLTTARPWQLGWGATTDELQRTLPGDDLVQNPTFNATRAITILAPPEDVWPWLVQVGVNRAGWYSYDLLDNLGRTSARRIMPELQTLRPGDLLPMSPDGKHGIRVHALEQPRWMIWGTPGDTTWAWVLDPLPRGEGTRLVTRVRSEYRWLSPTILFSLLLEFGDIWMMRRMLLNLRDRIEDAATSEPPASPAGQRRVPVA